MRKTRKQWLHATETYTSLKDYRTAKKFFRDITLERKKGFYTDKGIKQMISRTEKILKQTVGFKGTRKQQLAQQQKFLASFERLANKEFLEFSDFDGKQQLKKRHVVRREFFDGKTRFSRNVKFRTRTSKTDYRFSGDVYDYDSFKQKMDAYDPEERQKVLNHKYSFASGRYSRWTIAVKVALGIDASVSDKMLEKWLDEYEKSSN